MQNNNKKILTGRIYTFFVGHIITQDRIETKIKEAIYYLSQQKIVQ